MKQNYLTGFLVVLIFVVVYKYYTDYAKIFDTLINGFWEADRSFCNDSDIDMFCLYLDNDVDYKGSRACYILTKKDGQMVINQPTIATIKMKIFNSYNWTFSANTPKYFNIDFKDIDEDCIDIFPQSQNVRFYPACNKIVMYYNDTVTAVLYKNPIYTELKDMLEDKL